MLPNGFHFEHHIDGPGLHVGARVVAHAGLANYDPESPWRVCLNPSGLPRYVFTRTEDGATRYMEAWATKWESAIRDAVGRTENDRDPLTRPGSGHVETTHPRRGSRRKMRLPR